MSTYTDNLGVTLVEQAQAQKEVTINEAFVDFDKAIAGRLALATTGGTTTLTAAQALNAILRFSGTLASAATVNVPAETKFWLVRNDCTGSYDLTIKTSSGTGIIVPQGETRMLYCDGTNVLAVDAAIPDALTDRIDALELAEAYDLGVFFPGVPGASDIMLRIPVARDCEFPDDFAGSIADAAVASTTGAVLDVQVNGVSVGTITFGAADTTGTFASTGSPLPVALTAGDILAVLNDATPDATLADISIIFKGSR